MLPNIRLKSKGVENIIMRNRHESNRYNQLLWHEGKWEHRLPKSSLPCVMGSGSIFYWVDGARPQIATVGFSAN